MASHTIAVNTSLLIDTNQELNSSRNGYWNLVGSSMVHSDLRESTLEKLYDFLEVGKSYTITYTIAIGCGRVKVYLGDSTTVEKTIGGTYTENIVYTGTDKKLKFVGYGSVTLSYVKIVGLKDYITDQPLDLGTYTENKSYTLSYSPIAKQWLSFHSYLPNNYIIHPNSLLTKNNNSQLKQFNRGSYGIYFDSSIKPFIIETIFNENPLATKVFDNLTVNLKSELNNIPNNKFFDNVVLSTEYQCSGTITLDTSNLTKKERNWFIHKFNDLTNNSNEALFTNEWTNIQSQYPIDKVVNPDKIDNNKPWFQRARFRDKFLKVRFIENNLENTKITCNFVSTVYRPSQR